jgi:CheY-specific phosphatase CheX
MSSVTADSFAGLIALALERMAFVVVEPGDADPQEALTSCVAHACVRISGEFERVVCVSATPGLVGEVAAGMMGVETEEIDVAEHGGATVAELANVLGGELVMLLTGGDSTLTLGLPREVDAAEAAACLASSGDTGFAVVLTADTGRLLVAVHEG